MGIKKKGYNPGRIPTAKGSIKHKSKKDYNRKEITNVYGVKLWICSECQRTNPIDDNECIYCYWGIE